MPNLLEVGKFITDYGFFAFIIVGFGLVGIWLTVRFFLSLHNDIRDVTNITKQLGEKIVTNTGGDPTLHYSILREIESELQELRQDAEQHADKANTHYDTMDRLESGEAMLHCNVDKCPYMGKIVISLSEVVKKFDEFNLRAEESRKITGVSIEDIRKQNEILASEVSAQGKQLVQLLSDVLVGRTKSK